VTYDANVEKETLMTASTRTRLLLCLIVGLVALPAESLLLPVARTPNQATAAVEWSASLDKAELQLAAGNIDAYPPVYRKAIMGALSPADRSAAWRKFFQEYLDSHSSLNEDQTAVLRDAIDVASPEAFGSKITPETKQRISDIFTRAQQVLGQNVAKDLFVTLGPKQSAKANALPLKQQLADSIRSWRTVNASESAGECNCNIEIDTCDLTPDPWLACSELYTCEFDLSWPMCGPLWSWACTGWCKVIRWPWEM
jgi:hypothetical protein